MVKKKILYIHHGGGQGGAPSSLLFLIKSLDYDSFEPVVACGFKEPSAKEFFTKNGYNPINITSARFAHCYPSGYWSLFNIHHLKKILLWFIKYLKSKKEFIQFLKTVNPDIVHLNSLSIAPLAFVAKKKGFLVVLHVREAAIKLNKYDLIWYLLKKIANKYVDHVVYICKDNQDRLTGKREHTSVIYNPIPFEKFNRNIHQGIVRKDLHIHQDKIVLFFPGGSSPRPKGIFVFLKALHKIHATNKSVVAIIPKIEGNLDVLEEISILNLQNVVLKLPFTNQVEKYYAASDIVIAPFIVPHFSRAVIEAGAMAKPVIGSRIGGIEEVLHHEVNGLLCNVNNVDDLVNKMNTLISNSDKCKELGKNGYKIAKELYDARHYGEKIMNIYNKILNF